MARVWWSSLAVVRWRARMPRVLFAVACAAVVLAAVRHVSAPAGRMGVARAPLAVDDPAAVALAERFARSFLTWPSAEADATPPSADGADVPQVPAGVRQRVEWTDLVGLARRGGVELVTVVAGTDRGMYHLVVPVRRERGGLLAVAGAPAIVGGPPVDRTPRVPDEQEVDDQALVTVLQRALGNYLAGARTELLADLDAGAVVSLPDQHLRLVGIDADTWVIPGRRAAVALRAALPNGVELSLRYEVDVVRRGGRWLVRSIETNPIGR